MASCAGAANCGEHVVADTPARRRLACFPEANLNEDERQLDALESSWADFLHGLRTGLRFVRDGTASEKMLCMSFAEVRQQFDAYRQRHEQGDGTALIEAMKYACEEGVPAPYWLALEVVPRVSRVFREAITLHEAFGLEKDFPSAKRKTDKKPANSRRLLQHKHRLYWHVASLMHEESMSLDPALRRVLKEHDFPFGLTVARRLFEDQERVQRAHLGKTPSTTGVQAPSKKRAISRKP